MKFEQDSFKDADSMVLSAIGYIDFSKILSKNDHLTLFQAVTKLKEVETPRFLALDYPIKKGQYLDFLDVVVASERYKNIIIHDYVDIHSEEECSQFAALSCSLTDSEEAIVYRGTDESLIGWKEDCLFSVKKAPAQIKAADYLKEMLPNTSKIYLMGHSKGSNLALYSALQLRDEELPKIARICLLDGPGLCSDVFPEMNSHRIDSLVHAYEPEFDVVAKIFKINFTNTTILKSDDQGFMAHGLLTWQMENGKFLTAKENDPEAVWINNAINGLVADLSPSEREHFIDTLFDALGKKGAKTLFDLGKNPLKTFENILIKTFGISKKTRKEAVYAGLSMMIGSSFKELKKTKKAYDFFLTNFFLGMILILFGVIFLAIPSKALPITMLTILSLLFFLQIAFNMNKLWKSKWNFAECKVGLIFLAFTAALYGALWAKFDSISLFSSWFYGIFFLLFAGLLSYSLFENKKRSWFDYIWNVLEIILYIAVGVYILYAPEHFISYGTFTTGIILVIDGGIKIIR